MQDTQKHINKKAKSPAFLLYSSDFLTGCGNLTREEIGDYIVLLCYHHQTGRLTDKLIKLKTPSVTEDVMAKFEKDEDGLWYNLRLEKEIDISKKRSKSGAIGAAKRWQNDGKSNSKVIDKEKMIMKIEDDNESVNENDKIHTEVIDHLNNGADRQFEAVKSNTKYIDARIKEGATVDNLLDVIEYQVAEWRDSDMEKYLRPSTLFGNSKYQNYIENVRFKKSKGVSAAMVWRSRSDNNQSEADGSISILETINRLRANGTISQ